MYKKIFKAIKKFDTIVIARHVGVDPDALASQLALKKSIEKTFPNKKVLALGNSSIKFNYIGKCDKWDDNIENALLIVLDTPDKRRVDLGDFSKFSYSIKIDHHPFVEEFCNLEYIVDDASSTAELIIELIDNTKLVMDKEIAELLFIGLVSDTNRFLFSSSTHKTFASISELMKEYNLDIASLYEKIYLRPLAEVRLEGYIGENMIVTDNGVGYIKITNDIISKFKVDSASAGNMINNFNFIEEILVWVAISEDIKNDIIRVSIRSRGPVINQIAEKYNGGGHKFASGAKVKSFDDALLLVDELDEVCETYIDNHLS